MFERFTERAARWSRWSRKRPGVSGKITQARSTCCWTCCAKKRAAQAPRAFGAALDELCGQVEGIAARVLSNRDVDPDAVRHEVVRGLSDAGREANFRAESIPCWGKRAWPIPVLGHVAGIRTKLDLSRPLGVSVGAAHSYRASARFPAGSPIVELVDVADLVRAPGSWRQVPQTWKSS